VIALLAALALAVDPSVKPWPVGVGVQYRPAAVNATVAAGRPLSGLRCTEGGTTFSVHLELFANRRAVVIPAGIGVARPYRTTLGTVMPQGCSYPLRTLTPTGVVQVSEDAQGKHLTLGDLFRVWGEPLDTRRFGSFTSVSPVRVYVAGRLVRGPAASIPLRSGEQIVLELGGYVPPHPSFLFPKGS
jgi:hypothetical protein